MSIDGMTLEVELYKYQVESGDTLKFGTDDMLEAMGIVSDYEGHELLCLHSPSPFELFWNYYRNYSELVATIRVVYGNNTDDNGEDLEPTEYSVVREYDMEVW